MKRMFVILLAIVCFMSIAVAEATTLSVRGVGVIAVTADQARIVLGVRESAKNVLTAQATVNEKINAICSALLEAGIEQKNIGTESIYIYANYDYSGDEPRLVSYTATNTIAILVSDIERVGEYIDIAFSMGANTLDTVDLSAQNTEEAQKEALRLAVQNAFEKGGVIADAAGMSIGAVTSITESADYYYGGENGAKFSNYREIAPASADASTSVQASTLELTATVLVEFELSEGN